MNQIPNASPYLSMEERQSLMQKQDWKAVVAIAMHCAAIVLIFCAVYYLPHPLVILLALLLLGGQQLACSILMHDASHHSLFQSKKLNDWVGNWLGAYPVLNNVSDYRPYHKEHHLHAGTQEDPDLMLTRGYPTDRKSMIRKCIRDITGQTGIKAYAALFAMHLGYIAFTQSGDIHRVAAADRIPISERLKRLAGPLAAQLMIFCLLWTCLHPALYLLWIGGLLTTLQLSVRVRSIAEHSVIDNPLDPHQNTRTTYANWLERLLFAPYRVNYHLEHHMLMTVPFYNLPKMHELIKARGFYEQGTLARGYWEVIRHAGSSAERNMAKVKNGSK